MKSKRLRKIVVFAGILFLFIGIFVLASSHGVHAAMNEIQIIQLSDDTINPMTAEYIEKSIERAQKDRASMLILELDTPGGLVTSTRQIVKAIMASRVPVVVYIYPQGSRAGSAGVFITYASHVAAMAPSTNIGAAHPVSMDGKSSRTIWDALRDLVDSFTGKGAGRKEDRQTSPEQEEGVLADKILNDTVAFIRAVAKERDRNVLWAEKSVTESASITAEEALREKVVEIIAADEKDLLAQLHGRTVMVSGQSVTLDTESATLRHVEMDLRQKILNRLAHPNIAYILMILGFYGLLFEVTHPGFGVPGILGTIFIILAFFSLQMLPTNYAGVALVIVGLALFIAEALVPGFGFLTLGGIVCLILGSLLMFESQAAIMGVSWSLILSVSLATALITILLVRAVVMAHRKKSIAGKEGLIGQVGKAKSVISASKEGKVFVHGEIWDAVGTEDIQPGDKVKVIQVDGLMLTVEKLKQN